MPARSLSQLGAQGGQHGEGVGGMRAASLPPRSGRALRLQLRRDAGQRRAAAHGAQDKILPYSENDLYADGRGMRTPPRGHHLPRGGGGRARHQHRDGERHAGQPRSPSRSLRSCWRADGTATRSSAPTATAWWATGTAWWRTTWPRACRPRWSRSETARPGSSTRPSPWATGSCPRSPGEIPTDERWAVVAYVQALQLSQNAPVNTLPADVQRRLREGQTWSR